MTQRTKKTTCPSCGTAIRFRHDKNKVGMCPGCGEWLIQRTWLTRRPKVVDDEIESDAFEESDGWAPRVVDELE